MDYSSEDCMNMFTQGQTNWMITTLQGPRSGLLTNIAPISLQSSVNIFPNPAQNLINIRINPIITAAHLSIQDITGKSIFQKNINFHKGFIQVNLPDLNKGIYIIHVFNDQFTTVEKLIIE